MLKFQLYRTIMFYTAMKVLGPVEQPKSANTKCVWNGIKSQDPRVKFINYAFLD